MVDKGSEIFIRALILVLVAIVIGLMAIMMVDKMTISTIDDEMLMSFFTI